MSSSVTLDEKLFNKLQVYFAKEPYKRDYILQKRPIISSVTLDVLTIVIDNNHIDI